MFKYRVLLLVIVAGIFYQGYPSFFRNLVALSVSKSEMDTGSLFQYESNSQWYDSLATVVPYPLMMRWQWLDTNKFVLDNSDLDSLHQWQIAIKENDWLFLASMLDHLLNKGYPKPDIHQVDQKRQLGGIFVRAAELAYSQNDVLLAEQYLLRATEILEGQSILPNLDNAQARFLEGALLASTLEYLRYLGNVDFNCQRDDLYSCQNYYKGLLSIYHMGNDLPQLSCDSVVIGLWVEKLALFSNENNAGLQDESQLNWNDCSLEQKIYIAWIYEKIGAVESKNKILQEFVAEIDVPNCATVNDQQLLYFSTALIEYSSVVILLLHNCDKSLTIQESKDVLTGTENEYQIHVAFNKVPNGNLNWWTLPNTHYVPGWQIERRELPYMQSVELIMSENRPLLQICDGADDRGTIYSSAFEVDISPDKEYLLIGDVMSLNNVSTILIGFRFLNPITNSTNGIWLMPNNTNSFSHKFWIVPPSVQNGKFIISINTNLKTCYTFSSLAMVPLNKNNKFPIE